MDIKYFFIYICILVIHLHFFGFCLYAVYISRHVVLLVSNTRFMRMSVLHNGLSTLGLVVTHLKTETVSFRNVVNIVIDGACGKSPCQS
jgi:hypothetical protein